MAFFCGACRYRVTARPDWTVARVKQALFAGGIARANAPEGRRSTPGIQRWEDLVRAALWGRGACVSLLAAVRRRGAAAAGKASTQQQGAPQQHHSTTQHCDTPHHVMRHNNNNQQELLYAMERMADDKTLADYGVPPGCKAMIAIERAKLESGKPDMDSPYWN